MGKYNKGFIEKIYEEYKKCWKFKGVDEKLKLPKGTSGYLIRKNGLKTRQDIDADLLKDGLKWCSSCDSIKPLDDFYDDIGHLADKSNSCKVCVKERAKQNYIDNKEQCDKANRQWAKNNPEKMKKIKAKYREAHREEARASGIKRRTTPEGKKYIAEWRKNNKEQINERKKNRRKTDIEFRITCHLRSRISNMVSNGKAGSAIKDLGCTVKFLRTHLEDRFYKNSETGEMMTWKNYGIRGWHIDHIKPLASFNLSDRKQFLEACHYTNLQPLWYKENIRKGSKISEEYGNAY